MHSFCLILSSMSHALLELRLLPVNHLSFQGVKIIIQKRITTIKSCLKITAEDNFKYSNRPS